VPLKMRFMRNSPVANMIVAWRGCVQKPVAVAVGTKVVVLGTLASMGNVFAQRAGFAGVNLVKP